MGAKRFFLIGFILILLAAIPFTLYFLQKQQKGNINAAPATNLSFTPTSNSGSHLSKNIGDQFDLHVLLTPNSNLVTYVKLVIDYDSTKFATAGAGFAPNLTSFPAVLAPVTYSPGQVTVELSIGTNSTGVIQSPTEAGVLTLVANAANTAGSQSVWFDAQTTVLASCLNPQDPSNCPDNEASNVLSSSSPAFIDVAGTPLSPTPTPQPTPGPTTALKAPICQTFNADRNAFGNAPFSIALTATGISQQGTISKVTFNFGDGPTVDVITGGGIGTTHASVQMSHTYYNPGQYKASATLTDSTNTVSDTNACVLSLNILAAPTVGPGTPTPTAIIVPTATPTATLIPTVPPPTGVPLSGTPTGPGDVLVNVGIGGIILSIAGAAMFLLAL